MNKAYSQPENKLFQFNRWFIIFILLLSPLPKGGEVSFYSAILLALVLFSTFLWVLSVLKQPCLSNNLLNRLYLIPIGSLALYQLGVFLYGFKHNQSSLENFQVYMHLGISYTLLFSLILLHFNSRRYLTILTISLVMSGLFQAFYGVGVVLDIIEPWFFEKSIYIGNATGSFIDRSHFAGFLTMSIGLAIGLILAQRKDTPITLIGILEFFTSTKVLIRLAVVIMVIGIVMSHSRMGNIALFLALMLVGTIFILSLKNHRRRNFLFLISFLIIDVLVISQFFGLDELKKRIQNTHASIAIEISQADSGLPSQDHRYSLIHMDDLREDIFNDSVGLYLLNPYWGEGVTNFETSFANFTGSLYEKEIHHAYNDYLEILIENGVFKALPLIIFVLFVLYYSLSGIFHKESKYRSGMAVGTSISLLGLLIHSFGESNFYIPANAIMFISISAIAILLVFHSSPMRKRRH